MEFRALESKFKLPSWVLDFSQSWSLGLPFYGSGDLYEASKGLEAENFPSPSEMLSVTGYYCDEVLDLGNDDFEIGKCLDPFTKSAEMLLNMPETYRGGQDRTEAFWRTLIADQANGQSPAPLSLGTAFYQHMLMHNSMFLLNSEMTGHVDMTRIQPLARLAKTDGEAGNFIPPLDKIIRRKEIYQETMIAKERRDHNASFLDRDQLDLEKMIRDVLAEEGKALSFSHQLGTIFASRKVLRTR